MYTIKFCFESGDPVIIDANPGEKLLDVARKANVAIDAPCSGNGVCGKCRVRLASGTLNAPINRHITSEEYKAGWRLACLAVVTGDAEIEVPDIASAYRSRMKMADLSSPEEIAIFEDLRAQLEAAGIVPELRFDREDLKVWASPEALGRVYRNLIANALRHGGGGLTVSGGDGAICFSNELLPGSRPDPEHLFDRFYQSSPARGKGGAGLGLSIVRELMEQMDGQVSAQVTGDILEIKLSFRGT